MPDVPLYQKIAENNDGTGGDIVDVPIAGGIHHGGCLNLGSGHSGVDPYRFLMPKEMDKDRTFFKIILTTTPADFTMFTQTPLDARRTSSSAFQRTTTCRSLQDKPDVNDMIKQGQGLAFEYQRGQFVDEYFSVVFCVDQTKE